MINVAATPIAGIGDVEVEISDVNIFNQIKKNVFDLHYKMRILHGKFRFEKAVYYFDSQKNNINKVKFTLSEKGCDTANIDFDFIDTFLQPEDIVEIYALGELVYQGRISNVADNKVEIKPARAKLSELRYKGKFNSDYSAVDVIKKILDEKALDSGVEFNPEYIDSEFYNKMKIYYLPGDFIVNYETVADVIDTLIDKVDSDAVWGVNARGIFFVKYPANAVSQFFYSTEKRSDYAKISVSENWDKIEMTRAAVTRAGRKYSDEEKEQNPALVDEDDSVFCGVVGYESTPSYPVLDDFENLVGKKEALINLSTMLTADTVQERNKFALDYAYTMLKAQSAEKQVTLSKVPFRVGMLPGEKAYIQSEEKGFKILSDCSDLTGWTGAQIVKTASVVGDRHIKGNKSVYFYLPRSTNYPEQSFFVFFAKFSCRDFFTVNFRDSTGKTLFNRKYQITGKNWQQFSIPYKGKFTSIEFAFPAEFELDMLQCYCRTDKIFNLNIKKISTEIKGGVGLSQIEFGSQNATLNDSLQYLEWKIKQIDAINNI